MLPGFGSCCANEVGRPSTDAVSLLSISPAAETSDGSMIALIVFRCLETCLHFGAACVMSDMDVCMRLEFSDGLWWDVNAGEHESNEWLAALE